VGEPSGRVRAVACYPIFMSATTQIPVEEYLAASYSPDREFVEGVLVERNVGEKPHSKLQRNLVIALTARYPALHVSPELRMRSVDNRHRIPDVCVTLTEPETDVLQEPPYIAIEILSKDDSMSDILEKLAEYAAIGTPNIWLFDPRARHMYTYRTGVLEVVGADAIATGGELRVELARGEIFQD
jgi:Uma2 family endonuclease